MPRLWQGFIKDNRGHGRHFDCVVQGVQGRKGYTAMKVDILGTKYEIIFCEEGKTPELDGKDIDGCCFGFRKQILVYDLRKSKAWEGEPEETVIKVNNKQLRHEIIHAFLNESGLDCNTCTKADYGWARNEEMVDWIAIQFPKILKVYQELDIL